jgi:hypothetical protein
MPYEMKRYQHDAQTWRALLELTALAIDQRDIVAQASTYLRELDGSRRHGTACYVALRSASSFRKKAERRLAPART